MPKFNILIEVEPGAPVQPPKGAACNGCGVCCLVEPCPLGMLLSRKRQGACVALNWNASQLRYQCGALTATDAAAQGRLAWLPLLVRSWLRTCWHRLVLRWISAGSGCDCELAASDWPAPEPGALLAGHKSGPRVSSSAPSERIKHD